MNYNDAERQQIARAVEARDRIRKDEHFHDWLDIGQAFAVVRDAAMREVGTNSPQGPHYRRAWKAEIESEANKAWAEGFDSATRTHAVWLADNISEVSRWRDTLARNMRESLNHPTSVWRRYKAAHPNQDGKAVERKASPKEQITGLMEVNHKLKQDNERLKRQADDFDAGYDWNKDSSKDIAAVLFQKYPTKAREVASEIMRLVQSRTASKRKQKAELTSSLS